MNEGEISFMEKIILVVIDGLSYEDGKNGMSYLQHLVEYDKGTFHKVVGELPSISRPMYETILTGKAVLEHGIIGNDTVRVSKERSLFKVMRENGFKTAAAAYHWISELYVKAPFDFANDRFLSDDKSDIQRGIFYSVDDYPDSHLYCDAEYLRKSYKPDFMFVHPMGVDLAGHRHSRNSSGYRNSILSTDQNLSKFINLWLKDGYKVIITSDHGMNDDYGHGGTLDVERIVPMWIFADSNIDVKEVVGQKEIFSIICDIMKVK